MDFGFGVLLGVLLSVMVGRMWQANQFKLRLRKYTDEARN